MRRPLAGEGEVAWRKYAESLEEFQAARMDGLRSAVRLRLARLERRPTVLDRGCPPTTIYVMHPVAAEAWIERLFPQP